MLDIDYKNSVIYQDGKAEGEIRKSKDIAKKLLAKGLPINEIVEITNLSMEEIQNLP